jgi:hypothetical protein
MSNFSAVRSYGGNDEYIHIHILEVHQEDEEQKKL